MLHLVRVARQASIEQPELTARFVMPDWNTAHATLLVAARRMHADAVAQRDVLSRMGLGDTFLDGMEKSIAAFDSAGSTQGSGLSAHIGARAELRAIAIEIGMAVNALDGLVQIRFAGDADRLAEWTSARHVGRRRRNPLPSDTGEAAA